MCICLSVRLLLIFSFTSHVLGTVRTIIYNNKHGVRASVLQEAHSSVRPSGILLARTQGNGYNSVLGVSYWLELRVMGITQCQGYLIGWNSG